MSHDTDAPIPPVRVPTGISGLDDILAGGLFRGGIYIVCGAPGSGKTTFGNQVSSTRVAAGGRALYVTLLSETHARMLFQMRAMSFFDEAAVGQGLVYVNGFTAIESEGLEGLLRLVRRAVRDHRADLLVLDGMVTAGILARSGVDYKKFINELQTWVGVIGCTVLFLTSQSSDAMLLPEHSMVDGIFELRQQPIGLRAHRELTVTKFRGSAFVEGSHAYVISSDGIVVYPRTEARLTAAAAAASATDERASTGVAQLDQILGGGLMRGSGTLVLGPSGAGKTILGLHFLAAGAAAGERSLHFGFFETPPALLATSQRLGLPLPGAAQDGTVELLWQPASERLLDQLAHRLLETVRRRGVRRLVIDGLRGFHSAAHPERLAAYFAALMGELTAAGVTTILTDEARGLFIADVDVPSAAIASTLQNIVFLRQVEQGAELRRLLSVMKTRDSVHDRALYEFEVGAGGLRIMDRFDPSRTVLTGVSRSGGVPGKERR